MKNYSGIDLSMNIPPVVLGTETYSGNWGINYTSDQISEILAFALENGVKEIDTASSYGENHQVESLLGNAMSGQRRDFIIASKFHSNHSGITKGSPIESVSELERDFAETLKALKTDYLDIYYFHSGIDDLFFQDHIWYFLNSLVNTGSIKNLGLSLNHGLVKTGSNRQLLAAKDYGISVVQTVLNMISNEALQFVIPYCKAEGLTLYGRMPLAKGLLSGKYNTSSVFSENDPRGKDSKMTSAILHNLQSEQKKVSINHAIQWALEHASKVVVGTKNIEQLDGVIRASIQ